MKSNGLPIVGQKGPGFCKGCEIDLRTVDHFVEIQLKPGMVNDSEFEIGKYCPACFSHTARGTKSRLGRIEDRLAALERQMAEAPGAEH